jgi:hypothetical protein
MMKEFSPIFTLFQHATRLATRAARLELLGNLQALAVAVVHPPWCSLFLTSFSNLLNIERTVCWCSFCLLQILNFDQINLQSIGILKCVPFGRLVSNP